MIDDSLFACRQRQELIESLQHPAPGSEPLKFSSKYARSIPQQFLIILKKFFMLYNRMPEYNAGESLLSSHEGWQCESSRMAVSFMLLATVQEPFEP